MPVGAGAYTAVHAEAEVAEELQLRSLECGNETWLQPFTSLKASVPLVEKV